MRTIVLLIIYMLAFAGSNLCFKKVGIQPAQSLSWWTWFALGNAVGFICPVTISAALRGTSVPWVFAIAIGGGYFLLQLCLWLGASEPVGRIQMLGMVLIGVGLILVNFPKTA